MLIITENNIIYKLGRNSKENFDLIDEAENINPDYWWFHLDDYPSGHCVIFSDDIDIQMILIASNLVKQYSKLKADKKVKVAYTQIKNVKKTKILGRVLLHGVTKIISI